ncbi:unnamed protein product [Lactuca saligna]|uniref:Uncharacterized protein n=1 Tax=Lactuca saligna TaxID=75948 RepID=A0AA36EGR2_LACSI|nr:unnamed protein product [Lactuca saligna]
MIHLASPLLLQRRQAFLITNQTNDKLILITEWFHSQLGVRLLHRTDDYECDSSTTPVIASRLTSLTATLIGLSIQLDFSFQLEIDFIPSLALHLFTKISLHLSTKIFTGFCLNHFIERQVNQTIFSIYLTLKNSALNFFVVSNLSRPDLKQELLALGEQIGNAGSRLSEDFISGGLLFNMMIRVAAENQQGGVAAIDHGEMPNNFTCGNKSLYNDRVESFAAAAGEGQYRKPPSLDPEGAAEGHNSKTGGGGGKKKGKKGRQIDPALLGFKVTSNRIMMGEIQCIQD